MQLITSKFIMIDSIDNELKVVGDLRRETTFRGTSGGVNGASLEKVIAVLVDFGIKDVEEGTFNAEFVFELATGSKQVIDVAGGIRICAFDVCGENYG